MTFLEAVKLAYETGKAVRPVSWENTDKYIIWHDLRWKMHFIIAKQSAFLFIRLDDPIYLFSIEEWIEVDKGE